MFSRSIEKPLHVPHFKSQKTSPRFVSIDSQSQNSERFDEISSGLGIDHYYILLLVDVLSYFLVLKISVRWLVSSSAKMVRFRRRLQKNIPRKTDLRKMSIIIFYLGTGGKSATPEVAGDSSLFLPGGLCRFFVVSPVGIDPSMAKAQLEKNKIQFWFI